MNVWFFDMTLEKPLKIRPLQLKYYWDGQPYMRFKYTWALTQKLINTYNTLYVY
jgi:hypothetical protein